MLFYFQSDNPDTEKVHSDADNNSTQEESTVRDYVSSPGYDTSSSNAPTSSPDPCEYTYEGAIQDYKSRVLRASSGTFTSVSSTVTSVATATVTATTAAPIKALKSPGSEIEQRLNAFTNNAATSNGTANGNGENGIDKKNLPKIDINKRREMFEKEAAATAVTVRKSFDAPATKAIAEVTTKISIKDRVSSLENREEVKDAAVKKLNRLSGEFNRVKDRLSNIESPIVNSVAIEDKPPKIDVPVVPLKDRLFSLQSAAFEEKPREPPKKIDLLGDQRRVNSYANDNGNNNHDAGQQKVNGNGLNAKSEPSFEEPIFQPSPMKKDEPLKFFDELLVDDSDLQTMDAYHQLEIIQEERDEQQLQQQYHMPVAAKKPEVMPRTTRTITPDPQPQPTIVDQLVNVSLDDHNAPDAIDSDLNDDELDLEDDSVSVTHVLNINHNNNNNDSVDHDLDVNDVNNLVISENHKEMVVVATDDNNTIVNESNDQNIVDSSSSSINVLLTHQESTPEPLTISLSNTNSIISNNNNQANGVVTNVDTLIIEQTNDKPSMATIDSQEKRVDAEPAMSKNQRIKCQIVGVLEKNRKSIDLISSAPIVQSILQTINPSASNTAPPKSPKSPSKAKNIFDFIKRNLLNEATPDVAIDTNTHTAETHTAKSNTRIAVDSSKSFLSATAGHQKSEIDQLLDEELSKLSDDDDRH